MLYRHYKGNLYRVLFKNAIHSETSEYMVVYMSVGTGQIFVRPSKMFHESVGTADGLVPRFSEVPEFE